MVYGCSVGYAGGWGEKGICRGKQDRGERFDVATPNNNHLKCDIISKFALEKGINIFIVLLL